MMTKQFFDRAINSLLVFKDILLDKEKNKKYYELMKRDFTDEEFAQICGDICKTENLYNKYPDPYLFYKRKPKRTPEISIARDKQLFLRKVSDYLDSGFISTDERVEFNRSLTPVESLVLQKHGGISTLWTSVNRDEYARSLDAVLRELSADFEDMWEVDCQDNGKLRIGNDKPTSVIEAPVNHLLAHWKVNNDIKN